MAKIVLEELKLKELKLIKVVAISRSWRSWGPFDKASWRSQTLSRRSMTVDWPLL